MIYDKAELLERMFDDEELLEEVLQTFLGDMPKKIGLLEEAVRGNDATGVRHYAHSIKGAAGNASAPELHIAAHELEIIGESGDLSKAKECLGIIKDSFKAFTEAVEKEG